MFDTSKAFSGLSADDLDAAEQFYGGVLGLDVTRNDSGMLVIMLGSGGQILVYPKLDHTPASFTVLNFAVADVRAAVADLIAAGVIMQRYEGMPQDADGVMRAHGPEIAWFTDPAGNIISVVEDV